MPSLGFIVWDRRRKLKAEYQSLSGDQIRDIRMAGTDVTDEVRDSAVGLRRRYRPGRVGQLSGDVRSPHSDHGADVSSPPRTVKTRFTSSGISIWTIFWSAASGLRTN